MSNSNDNDNDNAATTTRLPTAEPLLSNSNDNANTTKRLPAAEPLLGKYEVGRLLGRGTFAKVYYARSVADNSPVAIKVLDKPEIVSTGVAPLILREVSAMRRLSHHPNILRLHEVMATKSKIYLVMEHARGGELFSRLARRGRLPEAAARRYFQQLISALRFCHAHGVSHRDVKPENLLLDRDGNLKLSDFGLSALPDQLRSDGLLHTACGTPAYTAPEVIRRKGYDGTKADAWSCGVILYVLLAGFLPFDDSNLANMYKRIQRREYQFPSCFSPSARRVVSKLLDPNPATRITVEGLTDLPWIRRAYSVDDRLNLLSYLPPQPPAATVQDHDDDADMLAAVSVSASAPSMNAFDIISLSSGLDLSGLFDEYGRRRARRFTSTASMERILERMEEVGEKFGYVIEKKKKGSGVVGRGRWGAVLSVVVSEMASPILLVEVRVDGGHCNGEDGEGLIRWGDLKDELGDLVFAWHHKNGDS